MKDNNGIYKKYNIEWIGREGLAPETHEEYLNDFINHFYKVRECFEISNWLIRIGFYSIYGFSNLLRKCQVDKMSG